jgi:hypothetical protein
MCNRLGPPSILARAKINIAVEKVMTIKKTKAFLKNVIRYKLLV